MVMKTGFAALLLSVSLALPAPSHAMRATQGRVAEVKPINAPVGPGLTSEDWSRVSVHLDGMLDSLLPDLGNMKLPVGISSPQEAVIPEIAKATIEVFQQALANPKRVADVVNALKKKGAQAPRLKELERKLSTFAKRAEKNRGKRLKLIGRAIEWSKAFLQWWGYAHRLAALTGKGAAPSCSVIPVTSFWERRTLLFRLLDKKSQWTNRRIIFGI
ncbi:MAG: hypothetical protein COB53_06345 [Elusimicrobia bacterium]|nr:MAG: hypothetical protein COB53_06345 [Elusimicrobiota bacterium]